MLITKSSKEKKLEIVELTHFIKKAQTKYRNNPADLENIVNDVFDLFLEWNSSFFESTADPIYADGRFTADMSDKFAPKMVLPKSTGFNPKMHALIEVNCNDNAEKKISKLSPEVLKRCQQLLKLFAFKKEQNTGIFIFEDPLLFFRVKRLLEEFKIKIDRLHCDRNRFEIIFLNLKLFIDNSEGEVKFRLDGLQMTSAESGMF